MKIRTSKRALAHAVAAAATVAHGSTAHAQSADAASPAGNIPPSTALEAVVVKAKKEPMYGTRDVNAGALGVQSLHELPFSIGSYGRELIDNQRNRTAQDVLKNDPSVQATSFGGTYSGVAVRGFSANAINSVRRDGLMTNIYADIPLENVERVDVLKGLSGFLYGVGEPSGLVNYVLKRPTSKPFISLDAEVRSHGGRYGHVDTSGALGENRAVGYRLNVAGEKQGDFTHADDMSRSMVSAAFDIKLGTDTLLRLDADHAKKTMASQPLIGPRTDGRVVPADSFDPRTLLGQPWGRYRTEGSNVAARLEQSLNSQWQLVAQWGYSRTTRDAAFPDIYSVSPAGRIGNTSADSDYYFSPHQRFSSTSAQAFLNGQWQLAGMKHELVLGSSFGQLKTSDAGWFPNEGLNVGNIYAPVYSPQPDFSNSPPKNQAKTRQPSLFASDTISLSAHWRVLLGARYIAYRNETFNASSGAARPYDVNVTVPSAAVMWLPNEAVTAYASYTEGLEQGAYAPTSSANKGERLNPIRSQQLELGLKWQAATGLSATAALFHIDKPLQSVDAGDNVFKTMGRQRHQGIELAVHGELTRELSAVAGLGWLDAKMLETEDIGSGKRPANAAKFQANAWIDWRVSGVPGLNLNAGLVHTGDRPLDKANTASAPAYTRWDAGARYATRVAGLPTVWRLQAENLADKRYWQNVNSGGVLAGAPRTVRLSGEWFF